MDADSVSVGSILMMEWCSDWCVHWLWYAVDHHVAEVCRGFRYLRPLLNQVSGVWRKCTFTNNWIETGHHSVFLPFAVIEFVFVWIQIYTSYSKNVITSWTIPAEKWIKTDFCIEKKTQLKPVNQEYRMTCTSEWNAAPALITVAHSVPYHCYSSCPSWKKASRFPWRKVPSAVRRDTPDSASSSSDSSTSASFMPLCFIAAMGITAPKSFSQQRPSVVGKQVSKFLTTFQFIPCEKPHLPPCLLPCSTSFHLHHSFFPWLLLPLPSAQLILIVLTRFIRLWPGVMSVITCWFAPPPLLTVLPCLPLVHPLAALGLQRPF